MRGLHTDGHEHIGVLSHQSGLLQSRTKRRSIRNGMVCRQDHHERLRIHTHKVPGGETHGSSGIAPYRLTEDIGRRDLRQLGDGLGL